MGAFFRQLLATILGLVIVLVGGFFLLILIGVGLGSSKKTLIPAHSTLHLVMPAAKLRHHSAEHARHFRLRQRHDLRHDSPCDVLGRRTERTHQHA